ncbi:unnamed protein product [Urochloa decumbens]|uniref:BTB domain-containing protein n=1 Tax=Urochloa decumbens TaxID=240449 RepID=A0ABC9ALS5_9POAL
MAMDSKAMSASAIVADSVSGSHVLKIEGYSRTKELSNGEIIQSSTHSMWEAIAGLSVTTLMEFRAEDTTKFVTVPPSDMHQHIGRLLSSGAEADVTFQVGEETFAAHRLVLGARSSVFMAELFGPMKEKHTSQIHVEDIEPGVFKAMLHYIYTDSLPEMEKGDASAMAQHLLVAADRYSVERLKEACFKFLRSPGNLKKIMDSDGFQHLTSSCPSLIRELLANVAP